MLLLVPGGFQEQLRQLLIALPLGNQGKEGVLIPGLALPGKGFLQVLFRLGAGIDGCGGSRLFLHLFKDGGRLPAHRAGKALGQFLALIDIPANLTFPFCHFLVISLF